MVRSQMIGLIARGAMGGDSLGPCMMILGPIIAICAICGIWKFCCRCRIRDCRCIKRCLRLCGTDPFDEFDMMILVHAAKFTSAARTTTFVRVRAGDQVVETERSGEGIFQETVSLLVEQGAPCVEFELCDSRKKVLASMKMDIMKDILKQEDGKTTLQTVNEKTLTMKPKQKSVLNPKVTITFSPDSMGDDEKAILGGINASKETEFMLTQHINKIAQTDGSKGASGKKLEELSEVELLAKSCAGPLERFGAMGKKERVHLEIIGPPKKKRVGLHTFKSEKEFKDGKPYMDEVDLLKVSSIAADPSRPEVFVVNYQDEHASRASLRFQRVDRSRDVWVEVLQLLVTKLHEERKNKKAAKK